MPISVSNPTVGNVHVDVPLSNFSQKFLQDSTAFISLRAFPNLPVQKRSDLYYTFDKNDFYREFGDLQRADSTETKGGGFNLSTEPYFAQVYGFHKDIGDQQLANEDTAVQLRKSAMQQVTEILTIDRERKFLDTFATAGVWANDEAAPPTPWSDATSDPIIDMRNARRTVLQKTGKLPNRAIFARNAYDTVLDNAAIIERIFGGTTPQNPAMAMKNVLAELFELDEIFVSNAVSNTSIEGAATQNVDFMLNNSVLLYHAPPGMGLNLPTAGGQFSWTGLYGSTPLGIRFKSFRQEWLSSTRIEGEMAFDYKVTSPELGYFWASVV